MLLETSQYLNSKYGTKIFKMYGMIKKTAKEGAKMQVIVEKELPEREALNLVADILTMFRKKGISFRQASEILTTAQTELQKLPLTE